LIPSRAPLGINIPAFSSSTLFPRMGKEKRKKGEGMGGGSKNIQNLDSLRAIHSNSRGNLSRGGGGRGEKRGEKKRRA